MNKPHYDFVFVVLVYRNTNDLVDFFSHLLIPNTKVVVVNSFFDEQSEGEFMKIANINGADFISVPNKGYGAGNNRGCEYAINHYEFEYIVISNADVEIMRMDINQLLPYNKCIIAPKIQTLSGKNQNPFMIRYHPSFDFLKNWCFYHNFQKVIYFFSIISRLERELFLKITFPLFCRKKIYASHGAFVIIPYDIIIKLCPIYNEQMFLFAEEEHLAQLARKSDIPIVYFPQIIIRHKEDGSTGLLNNDYEYVRDSFMKFYKYWHNKES